MIFICLAFVFFVVIFTICTTVARLILNNSVPKSVYYTPTYLCFNRKHIIPVLVYSSYKQKANPDLLETYIPCPVKFNEPFMMVFDKEMLETHITNSNPEMLYIAERKLLAEKTSYQTILDDVRKELANKYLEKIYH